MTQYRWVVLKVEIDPSEAKSVEEELGMKFNSVEEYIEYELKWLEDSFKDLEILEISDEYDNNIGEDGE